MKERVFRFKKFSVAHSRSAMKVGMDGVLAGCAARLAGSARILDAGCGCGLIALICAQRCEAAEIEAIDTHLPSVEEAADNFAASPWASRLAARHLDFCSLGKGEYDHIISNPPFFDAGIIAPATDRQTARHTAVFSPVSLIGIGARLINPAGAVSLISPPDWLDRLHSQADISGMALSYILYVKGTVSGPVKRIFTEWRHREYAGRCVEDSLAVERSPGCYTEKYKELTSEFYLKF